MAPNGEQPFVSCLETSLLVGPPEERNLYICWFSDNSIILCNNLSNSFPPVVLSKKPNAIYFWCLLFWLFLRCFLERLGTLFCHHFEILEVSEALDDTVRTAKMRSTIWDRSRSLRSSKNNENKGNTSWNVLGHCFVTNEVFWRFPELKITRFEPQKWDLQSETGPGASGAQKNIKK